ncbi:endo-1,4-beta-xylanase [Pedobacter sp. MW01-1-1]|uniref:endo-1,4-beta-xylanase n=1 Tax=Pedobacter sp. MW01-1-1 TaxID=3383027 RepID=UPI003FF0E3D7
MIPTTIFSHRTFQASFKVFFMCAFLQLSEVHAQEGLKDYYKKYFPIGVAVRPSDLSGAEATFIKTQFNSLTAENAMKMVSIQPRQDKFFWHYADSIVNFGIRNKMKVRGHTLCWHTQAPEWMFVNSDGKNVSKDTLLKRLEKHITTVVSRYKGKVYAWDVVNEVIADDATFYRKTKWYEIAGDEFIEKAFEYAHKADPKALLFYNDYNTEIPAKREKIAQMLKNLLAKGVPIHGIGLQGHWSINNPSAEELDKSIQLFSSLGLQIQITELDVSVYAGRQGGQISKDKNAEEKATFTTEMEDLQRAKYKMIFEVFRKNKKKITGVTFWNVSDKYSWLDNRGKKNFPLLFDENLAPKKAYWEVVKF